MEAVRDEMGAELPSEARKDAIERDSPKLVGILKEMKAGLDVVRAKVQDLTEKVKQNEYPTGDGISYLEVKHLLLIGYCQTIVYYLLRKAKGLPIGGHPLVRNLVEIRLFLEKIRPIDKKLEYQVQKLTTAANAAEVDKISSAENMEGESHETDDPLKYRPNPDMLLSKTAQDPQDGVYRPPRFAPAAMDEDKMSKQEKQTIRREKEALRRVKQNAIFKEFMDEVEGRPEEVKEFIGHESREMERYKAKWEQRALEEEELFTRVPISKQEKKQARHLLKSRDGLMGLSDGFYDDLRVLPFEEKGNNDDSMPSYDVISNRKKSTKRKRNH